MDRKKLILIILLVVGVLVFGFFLYYFFFRPIVQLTTNSNVTESSTDQLTTSGTGDNRNISSGQNPLSQSTSTRRAIEQPAETAQGGLTKISQLTAVPAYFATSGAGGEILYYDKNTGKFYRIASDGTIIALSNQVFHDVTNVTWANNRQKAILEYPDSSKILFDFTTNKQITLPKHWEDFSFAPSDQKIAFKSIGLSPENRFLTIANSDGSQARAIESIGGVEDQFQVNWSPNDQMIANFTEGKDLNRSEVYFVGINKENFKSMTVEGRDFQGKWSPKGEMMLYSVYDSNNNFKPQLWIVDATSNTTGNNRKNLNLETWSNKCTFSGNNTVYCAVPSNLPFGAGLDQQETDASPDQIYSLDLTTGSKNLLAIPETDHTIGQIIVGDGYLFFTDKDTKKIYKISLPRP